MKVLDTRVLVKIKETEAPVTKIGAMEIREDKPGWETADVVEVGEKVEGLKPGNEVLIYPGAGKEIKVQGESYRVISSAEVIVVL